MNAFESVHISSHSCLAGCPQGPVPAYPQRITNDIKISQHFVRKLQSRESLILRDMQRNIVAL